MIFKLDTGAEVTAKIESILAKLGHVKLSPVTKSLCGPHRKPLHVIVKKAIALMVQSVVLFIALL